MNSEKETTAFENLKKAVEEYINQIKTQATLHLMTMINSGFMIHMATVGI